MGMRLYRSRFWVKMMPKRIVKIRLSKNKYGNRNGDQEGNDYRARVKIGSSSLSAENKGVH